jgi:hypothetical protein
VTPSPYCTHGHKLVLGANARTYGYLQPNNGTVFPRALHTPRATTPDSLPPLMPTLSWLLCFPFRFWPLKAKATPIAIFFDGVCVGVPNEGTGCGTAKPDHGQLS